MAVADEEAAPGTVERGRLLFCLRGAEEEAGVAVGELAPEFAGRQADVEGHEDGAQGGEGVDEEKDVGTVGHEDGDVVAGRDAGGVQTGRQGSRFLFQFGVAPAAPANKEGGRVRGRPGASR